METTRFLPVTLPNGHIVHVEATVLRSEHDVAGKDFDFGDISAPLEGIAKAVSSSLDVIKPKKASVEFGLEVGVESGKLTALLVKGTAKASLKITLNWEN
jgi:hypothetical protein